MPDLDIPNIAIITPSPLPVCPFTIVADNNEQAPYRFDQMPSQYAAGGLLAVKVERRSLDTGDYSLAGMEAEIAIERKSLADLFGTLGQHRERFEREVQRLAEMSFAAIVIEADLRELWRPAEFHTDWRSRLNPKSVEGTIVSWSLKYPTVHWWCCGSRRAAEVRTFKVLEMFWRKESRHGGHED